MESENNYRERNAKYWKYAEINWCYGVNIWLSARQAGSVWTKPSTKFLMKYIMDLESQNKPSSSLKNMKDLWNQEKSCW